MLSKQAEVTDRQVLLFYTLDGKAIWQKQKQELSGRQEGMKERDIILRSFLVPAKDDAAVKEWRIDTRKQFTFILVGKDGGEKFRSNDVITSDKLFALVDAMPMRKNEQKRSNGERAD